ncbi:serine hydrolase [candidate division KSB1 bacterium]|nr:serine hydrolase [candidate division KSB1 bacterium]
MKLCALVAFVLWFGWSVDVGAQPSGPRSIAAQGVAREQAEPSSLPRPHAVTALDTTRLNAFIDSVMQANNTPGVAVCAIHDSDIIWSHAYGWANVQQQWPVGDSTLFMQASVSKVVTAVALMQLWEDGWFELDDPVNDFLPFAVSNPSYPTAVITFRMLLTHGSSIRDWWTVLDSLRRPGDPTVTIAEFLQNYLVPGGQYYNASQCFLPQPPGAAMTYTNVGATLIGYLVERISDLPFHLYCEANIFSPLGMDRSVWYLQGLDTTTLATPYMPNGSTPYVLYSSPLVPAAMLRTNIPEMSRFLLSLMNRGEVGGVRILDAATVDTMCAAHAQGPWGPQGLILRESEAVPYDSLWFHPGSYSGVSTQFQWDAISRIGVLVMINGRNGPNDSQITTLADEIYITAQEAIQCEPATQVTGYLASGAGQIEIRYLAPTDGTYQVWKTSNPGNDGDPDAGTDPDWMLVGTQNVAAGENLFSVSAGTESYANFVVVHDCGPVMR